MRLRALLLLGAAFTRPVTLARYRRITLVTLVSLVVIMVTGAAVRLTDSGLGCSTWPACEPDSFTPHSASDLNGMVEFVNRLITGLVMLLCAVAVLGAHRLVDRRRDLFRWSLGLPVWVLGNAVVGGLVVVLDLAPLSVIGHFLLSLGAVWNATVLHERAMEDRPPAGERRSVATDAVVGTCRLLVAAAALVIVSGTVVTGSGPHAGDEAAERLDFRVGEVARLHGMAMVLFLALTLVVLAMARRGDATPGVGRRLVQLLVVLVAQAGVGYAQYFTGVPAALVGIHVLGAALVWIAVVRVVLGLSEPAPVALAGPEPAAAAASAPSPADAQEGDRQPAPARTGAAAGVAAGRAPSAGDPGAGLGRRRSAIGVRE